MHPRSVAISGNLITYYHDFLINKPLELKYLVSKNEHTAPSCGNHFCWNSKKC